MRKGGEIESKRDLPPSVVRGELDCESVGRGGGGETMNVLTSLAKERVPF